MDMMWILSIAAIIALAVVLTRVLTVVIKGVILAAVLYFVFTKVDFNEVQKKVEHWIKPYSHHFKKLPDLPRRGRKGESPAL